jgi:hypothetical protein
MSGSLCATRLTAREAEILVLVWIGTALLGYLPMLTTKTQI